MELILCPRNEEKLHLVESYRKISDSKMFDADELFYSGKCYKIPFIPHTGDLADRTFLTYTDNGYKVYVMNGYLQELCEVQELSVTKTELGKSYGDRLDLLLEKLAEL